MKPSNLKKDAQASIRINSKVKDKIKVKGKSVQKIIDDFIDKQFKIDKELNLKG